MVTATCTHEDDETKRSKVLRAFVARIPSLAIGLLTVAALSLGNFVAGAGRASADPGCSPNPLTVLPCTVFNKTVGAAVGGSFDKIVESMNEAMGKALELSMSWWIAMPSPKLGPQENSQSGSILQIVRDYTLELQIVGLIVSLSFVALRMAVSRKGLVEESEAAWTSLVRAVFTTTMFSSFVMLGTAIGDAFSNWVLGSVVLKGNTGGEVIKTMQLGAVSGLMPVAGVAIIALVGFLGALLQLFLLVMRQAMLIVVMAMIPIAATWAGTGPGSQAYQKLQGWVIAFLLFKPVGALVYVVAFTAAGTPSQDPQMKLLGIVLFTMAAFVLPSLMKLVAPAIGAMGGGGSGLAAAGMVAGAAVAVGSLVATGGASGAAGAGAGMSSVASRGPSAVGGKPGPPSGPPSGGGQGGPGPKPSPGPTPGSGSPSSGQGGGGGRNPGPAKSSLPGGAAGGVAGSAAQLAQSAPEGESNASAPSTPVAAGAAAERPALQSGYGAHAMKG